MANEQIANFSLYVDGQLLKRFGQREFEAKLGPISPDADHRYTLTESSLAGTESTALPRCASCRGSRTVARGRYRCAQGAALHLGRLVQVSTPSAREGTVVGPTDVSVLPRNRG